MRILSHYFIARYLGLFSMVLAVAFLVLGTIELVLNFDDVSNFGASAAADAGGTGSSSVFDDSGLGAVARTLQSIAIRLVSYYLSDLLPIASFIAVFITFAIAGRAMELVAIEAGGIRPARIVLPIMATALILSLATAVLHETVILRAEQIWSGDRLEGQDEIEFGRDSFWYHKGATITNVSLADPETRTLHGVEIFERSVNGSVTRVIRADRVRIADEGVWQVESATIWTFDAEDVAAAPKLDVSIDLDLDALQGDLLLRADPELLPLPALARYLESNPQATHSTVRRALGRFHERLSSPWLVLVFAWIAMPFALRIDERGHFAGPAVAAVSSLGLYFMFESAGRALAQETLIPVGVTPWLAMAFFSFAATVSVAFRAR